MEENQRKKEIVQKIKVCFPLFAFNVCCWPAASLRVASALRKMPGKVCGKMRMCCSHDSEFAAT